MTDGTYSQIIIAREALSESGDHERPGTFDSPICFIVLFLAKDLVRASADSSLCLLAGDFLRGEAGRY
jgi:hypothetical protein